MTQRALFARDQVTMRSTGALGGPIDSGQYPAGLSAATLSHGCRIACHL